MSISSTLRLNANELDNNFVESIKTLFKGKDIEIVTKNVKKNPKESLIMILMFKLFLYNFSLI